MSNLTDALIAAKLIGAQGGGSGGGSGESELFIIHGKITDDDALIMEESFAELESAWVAGKVLFFALPYDDEISLSYFLVAPRDIDSNGIISFRAKDIYINEIPGGGAVLRNYIIEINRDSSITETSNEYPIAFSNS